MGPICVILCATITFCAYKPAVWLAWTIATYNSSTLYLQTPNVEGYQSASTTLTTHGILDTVEIMKYANVSFVLIMQRCYYYVLYWFMRACA